MHAYCRTYGEARTPSTRPKDLVDILLIESSADIEARPLRHALEDTFRERKHQPLPDSLPPPPAAWADPYGRLARSVNIEPDLLAAYARAAAFLDPVLAGDANGRWDARRRTWAPAPSRDR